MKPKVQWLGLADEKVRKDLKSLFTKELQAAFTAADTGQQVRRIVVQNCLAGHRTDQSQKVILAVETRSADAYHSHIVKLGSRALVGPDFLGWRRCAAGRYISSRIFVKVLGTSLLKGRAAAIYQDAYLFYGLDPKDQPKSLEEVVDWAINDDKPKPCSVERVLRQIYGDLYRWFYRTADTDVKVAASFYQNRLKKALHKWDPSGCRKEQEKADAQWRQRLRQDAVWLFCGQDPPDPQKPAQYLDPYDFVTWALKRGQIPPTLVGRSHGDLHGRNILTGVQRGEAEFPVVIDYGEMSDKNVLAWDFAKLEVELKTRILPKLFQDSEAREALLSRRKDKPPNENLALESFVAKHEKGEQETGPVDVAIERLLRARGDPHARDRVFQAKRHAFAFEFESLLAELTARIGGRQDAECCKPPGGRLPLSIHHKIDRALTLILRIRQEAALCLGYYQPGRYSLWQDEYYFALAVYGLATAKWPTYEPYWSESALISAGVAAAQTELARRAIAERLKREPPPADYPTHGVPLFHAHRRWMVGDLDDAANLLAKSRSHFEHAVPLHVEYALVLAGKGDLTKAQELLDPLVTIAIDFRDYEMLSRIGSVLKKFGDKAWQCQVDSFELKDGSPAAQYYSQACAYYTLGFIISGNYFPGVNAATLSRLLQMSAAAGELAENVLSICRTEQLSARGADLYWLFASEGEAALVSGRGGAAQQAVNFYDQALNVVGPENIGMLQSTWNQLCRLWRALGKDLRRSCGQRFSEAQKPVDQA